MKFIQKLFFSGETEEALEVYKQAFGCTVRNLLHYSDPRTKNEVQAAIIEDIKAHPKFIISGVTMNCSFPLC